MVCTLGSSDRETKMENPTNTNTVYVVRMIKDHELIGIFAAHDPYSLFLLVDEREDPTVCEYAEMSEGGIFCTDSFRIEPRIDPEDERNIPTAYYGFTEEWSEILKGSWHVGWTSFAKANAKYEKKLKKHSKTIPDGWSFP
jgi:hypothetical protein